MTASRSQAAHDFGMATRPATAARIVIDDRLRVELSTARTALAVTLTPAAARRVGDTLNEFADRLDAAHNARCPGTGRTPRTSR